MKYLFIILVLMGGVYHFTMASDPVDDLMQRLSVKEGAGIKVLTQQGGAGFNVYDLPVPGLMTIVEFYTESCPGCKKLKSQYKRFLKVRPDVAVRRVRMPDDWQPDWAKRQFGLMIGSTPHVLVFNENGEPVAMDEGENKAGFTMLYAWMNAELRKQWERK